MSNVNDILLSVFFGYIVAILIIFKNPFIFLNLCYDIVPLVVLVLFLLIKYRDKKGEAMNGDIDHRI